MSRSSLAVTLRNVRLLTQAAVQHLADDPALLMIQMSRRMPFRLRLSTGRVLETATPVLPAIGALGSLMAGRIDAAESTIERISAQPQHRASGLVGEVAVLLDRIDLMPADVPAATRARAAWSRGDLSIALQILDGAGVHSSRYARRLRSERQLLQTGYRLPTSTVGDASISESPADEGRRLRVLHILTNSLPHTQSGYSLRSHRILTALRDQGIDSVALTRAGYPVMVGVVTACDEDVVDGVRYVRTLPSKLPQTQEERLQVEVACALQLVREHRPHVIHTTTNYLNALVAQAISDATGLPWVFEVRGLMEQTWVASHRSGHARDAATASEKHRLIAAKEGEQARDADAVITLSRTMADELAFRGVDHSGITLVPNGVDESLFEDHIDTAEARRRTGLAGITGFGSDAFLVGAVSALVDYEGYEVLLHAVARIVADESLPTGLRDRIHVVLAGDGVSRPGLAATADELGIGQRVHLPGRVPREAARLWVESLDVVVVPRRDVAVARAVTPQKPIEAMALGRPVIASDLSALREVLTGADGTLAGSLVPAEDPIALATAIAHLGTNPATLESHQVVAQSLARDRAWPRQVSRFCEVYEKVKIRSKDGGADGK